jgi:hypothetical protein
MEAVMDYHSLVAAHLRCRRLPRRMNATAEDRYWRAQMDRPRRRLPLRASIAVTGGAILLLIGMAPA